MNTDDDPEELLEIENERVDKSFIEKLILANKKSNDEQNSKQELEQNEAYCRNKNYMNCRRPKKYQQFIMK